MNLDLPPEVREALGALDRLLAGGDRPVDLLWLAMADMGLLGLCLPESVGGFGQDARALLHTAEALGRRSCEVPYASTVAACASVIARHGTAAQQQEWLPAIAAGRARWALACAPAAPTRVRARRAGAQLQLDGQMPVVLDAQAAQHLLVAASLEEGEAPVLVALPSGAAGVTLRACRTFDDRHAADLDLQAVRVSADAVLGDAEGRHLAAADALAMACIALTGETVGMMRTLLALTQDYLRTRKQFGQPLAAFQALQHRAADMLLALEQTASIGEYAAHLQGTVEAHRATAAAKAYAGTAARSFAKSAIQLHGAMGLVQEMPAARLARRLTMVDAWFGSASHHLAERLATDPELA